MNYNKVRKVLVLVSLGVAYGMQGGLFGLSFQYPYDNDSISGPDLTFNYNPDDENAKTCTPTTRIIPKCIVA